MKLKIQSSLLLLFFTFCVSKAEIIENKRNTVDNDMISIYQLDNSNENSSFDHNYRKPRKKKITGKASYYSNKYQRKKTASGEKYKRRKKTAAHRTLPFGTKVRVKNLANGKSVKVRINDRGPFVAGREIDLSKKAFSKIGNLKDGVLNVEMTILN
ncbi:septal ring lytic transglycosylase RlpA family protein [Chishuiella sp.]|uniref:septal ring lytic transglycosylase RlpA family protein n=1 Tax=Chishuiella sp. TaxID=1969467 RepID=UPI0028A66373|nr:septal ring lytic transglycosylase RlpA family protein [Chishuiella sp.]